MSLLIVYINISYYFNLNIFMCLIVLITTLIFILRSHIWYSYLLYELSIIPILLIIIRGGLNPYRFNAFYFILIYSLVCSLPVLIFLLFIIKINMSITLRFKNFYLTDLSYSLILIIFFVKTPIYLLHFWLPKAHVEASTLGSIILARVILKLGTVGCLKVVTWCRYKIIVNKRYFLLSLVIISLSCVLQSDFKKLIALTSVIHITIRLTLILNMSGARFKGFLVININHTLNSCLIFFFRGIIFKISSSRMLYLQRILKYNIIFLLTRFIVILNLGVPPFYSFLGEILYFSHIIVENIRFFVLRIFLVLFITIYRLILINNMKHITSLRVNFNVLIMYLCTIIVVLIFWFIK